MPEHPATEGLHPLRHNFAEELGSNEPEKYSMATIEAVSSGTRGQGLPRTSRGNSMIASLASSHTQEEQRVPIHKSTPRQQLARANQKSTHNV